MITGLTDGQTTLTVTPEVGFGPSATTIAITLNVVTTPVLVTDITVTGLPAKIFVGETTTLNATVVPTNATFRRLTYSSQTPQFASIDENGVITGVAKGMATIRVTATDSGAFYKDFTIEIDQVISVISANINNKPTYSDATEYTEWAVGESYTLTYTMTPADGSAYTLQWSSSDDTVASVANGVVTFLKAGTATITLTCPDTGYTDTVSFTVGEGYIREEFNNSSYYSWNVTAAHITSGAVVTWNSAGYINCKTYMSNSTTGRADFSKVAPKVTLHAGNYPIVAFKMTNPLDTHTADGVTQCRMTLDAAPNLGSFGNSFNKYTTYDAGDGIKIYYYDMAAVTWGSANKMSTTAATELTTFQIKVADIKTISAPVYYNVYWVRTFKSEADLKAFADAHHD